jgi:hypothetical protein
VLTVLLIFPQGHQEVTAKHLFACCMMVLPSRFLRPRVTEDLVMTQVRAIAEQRAEELKRKEPDGVSLPPPPVALPPPPRPAANPLPPPPAARPPPQQVFISAALLRFSCGSALTCTTCPAWLGHASSLRCILLHAF